MAVSHNRRWKPFADKNMSKTGVNRKEGCSTKAMAHLGKNIDVHIEVLVKTYKALDGTMKNIMEIIPGREAVAND